LGHYGNAASVACIADWAGVSTGTVTNLCYRVAIALLDHHDTSITWPTPAQCADAKAYAVQRSECETWAGGYLAVDGTAIKLYQKPGLFGESWYNKDSVYAIALQVRITYQVVILVDTLEIVNYSVGNVRSVHDSVAFQDTRIAAEHDRLLQCGDRLLADAAYPLMPWCITPFRKPVGKQLSRERRHFNYWHSRLRVQVECAIGLLKGTWQSLHELRIQIKNLHAHAWAIIWIRCALILHNLII
ncbi:hypothetical protein CERSUDRAFT_40060, partial [Gelatoporia subvermispora B]